MVVVLTLAVVVVLLEVLVVAMVAVLMVVAVFVLVLLLVRGVLLLVVAVVMMVVAVVMVGLLAAVVLVARSQWLYLKLQERFRSIYAFKIPFGDNLVEGSSCNVKSESERAQVLRRADLIICDEITLSTRST